MVRTTILLIISDKWLVNYLPQCLLRFQSRLLWPLVTSGLCIGPNWYSLITARSKGKAIILYMVSVHLFWVECERIQGVLNLSDTLYHLGQFALQLQHEVVEVIWQLSYQTWNTLPHTGWPLSRHSEIPWHFPDNSLTMCGTHAHVKWYS